MIAQSFGKISSLLAGRASNMPVVISRIVKLLSDINLLPEHSQGSTIIRKFGGVIVYYLTKHQRSTSLPANVGAASKSSIVALRSSIAAAPSRLPSLFKAILSASS